MQLTNDHKKALKAVQDGADVFGYGIAEKLRECEREGFVEICDAVGNYPGASQQPYFGAVLTEKGFAAIGCEIAEELLVRIGDTGLFQYDGNNMSQGLAWDEARKIIEAALRPRLTRRNYVRSQT